MDRSIYVAWVPHGKPTMFVTLGHGLSDAPVCEAQGPFSNFMLAAKWLAEHPEKDAVPLIFEANE